MQRGGWTYVVTNKPRGVLYVGVTADLAARIVQHKAGRGAAFCRRYNLTQLVHVEPHPTIEEAIAREKALKAWKRERDEEHARYEQMSSHKAPTLEAPTTVQ